MHRTTEDANDILVRVCLGFLRVFSGDRGNNPGNLRLSGHCSRPRVPCDRKPRPEDATPEEIARAAAEAEANRQDKEAKAQCREENRRKKEAEHRAWLSIGGPRVLLRTMMRHTEFYGTDANDLTVGSIQSDPFRVDTPTNHKVGQWLKAHVPTGRKIHSR